MSIGKRIVNVKISVVPRFISVVWKNHCLGRYCIFLLALASFDATAQVEPFVPTNNLGMVNGTELQQRTGNTIQTVCGMFDGGNALDPAGDTDLQFMLFERCRELVNTNNDLMAIDGAPTGFSLGIGETELNSALQNIAGEEIAAAGSLATESALAQGSMLSNRFAAILSNVSKLQVGALNTQGSSGIVVASHDQYFGQGGNAASHSLLASEIPVSVYVSGVGGVSEKDTTDGEDGFDADSGGLLVGADFRVLSNFVAGASLGFRTDSADFNSSTNVEGGSLDADQVDLSGYLLYFGEKGFVDFVAGIGTGSYDLERRVVIGDFDGDPTTNTFDQTAVADTNSRSSRLALGGGREFAFGRYTVAPFGRWSFTDINLDGYEESGADELNLRVRDQSITSITLGGGARFVAAFSTSRAVILPQFNIEYVRELRDDAREIVSTYVHDPRQIELTLVTDDPDQDYFLAGLGVSAVFSNRVQAFGEVRSLLGLEDISQTIVSAGVRYEF